ncbi:hypothetical protein BJ170DRAFT_632505 [Xylariales sp. AK1849]|nr:hypothetical protein BJ170DRAFT_632505 [Xylariales sp. AK1849]
MMVLRIPGTLGLNMAALWIAMPLIARSFRLRALEGGSQFQSSQEQCNPSTRFDIGASESQDVHSRHITECHEVIAMVHAACFPSYVMACDGYPCEDRHPLAVLVSFHVHRASGLVLAQTNSPLSWDGWKSRSPEEYLDNSPITPMLHLCLDIINTCVKNHNACRVRAALVAVLAG